MKKTSIFILSLVCCHAVTAQSPYRLQQCRELALQNHATMKNADDNVLSAEEQRKEAFTKYFPQVNAVGGWFHANKDMMSVDVTPSELIPSELAQTLSTMVPVEALAPLANPVSFSLMQKGTMAGVMAMQPVFAGGQIINGNKLAKLGVEVSQLQRQQTSQQIALQTEQYYWQIVSLKEKMKTVVATEELLRKLESDVTLAVKAGLSQRNDLLQVQLKQNETAAAKVQLANGIRLSKMVLAQHIGVDYSDGFDIADEDLLNRTPEAPETWRVSHQDALAATPEYALLQANVTAKQLEKKLETGKNLPSVAVGAGYNYYDMLNSHRTFGMVLATVSIPISGWWGGSHAIRRRQYQVNTAENDLRNNSQLLVIRMQKEYDALDNAWQQAVISRKSMEQTAENLRLNQDYYRAGTTTMTDLLQAQTLMQHACDSYADAYKDYQIARVGYLIATGRGN